MAKRNISGNRGESHDIQEKQLSWEGIYGEEFPQMLLDNLEAAVYICDAAGYITMYNAAAATLWGREPVIGKDLWCGSWKIFEVDGITPVPLDSCPMAITLKQGKPIKGREIIIQKPNGERCFVVPHPRPFFDDLGQVAGALNLLVDVSAFKRREEGEAHMAAIVHSSDDAIISKTLDGIITSWNRAAEKIFGYTSREMIGQSVLKIIPPDRWDEEYEIQDQLRKGNRIDHYVTKRITREGKFLDVSLTISPILDKQGNIIGASKIARDITRQKSDELALRESAERYRLAVETAKLGTWGLNPLSMELVCSSECRTIFGISDDLCLNFEGLMQMVHPRDRTLVLSRFESVSNPANTQDYDIEHRIIRVNDKSTRWIRVKGKMYFNTQEKPEKMIGTMLDITDEKMAKEELERTVEERTVDLQKMNEQLRRSNHDLAQFAYIASHDLQEPLRKIQSFIDILEQNGVQEANQVYFNKIKGSARRMSALIKDVLNYSRIDKNEALFASVDLNHVLNSVKSDYENLIREKSAIIKSARLPVINGIESQLRQLFANLISNSLKFSSAHPEITITASILTADEIKDYPALETGRSYLGISFSDNGIGFEQQYADKIFMIFQRLHSRMEYGGTGIGLALCKKIAENHHGIIKATAKPGEGAVFLVLLPV